MPNRLALEVFVSSGHSLLCPCDYGLETSGSGIMVLPLLR